MSRDRNAKSGEQLLAAYIDGVAELSPDERRSVEADLAARPGARDDERALRGLIGELRELPPDAGEPDWNALAHAIGAAVGPDAPAPPWWRARRWRWLAPASAMVAAAAVAVLALRAPGGDAPAPPIAWRPPAPAVAAPAGEPSSTVTLWLDGAAVEVDASALALLGDPELGDGPAADELLPGASLSWIDALDDAEAERAVRALDQATAPAGSAGAPVRTGSSG